MATATLSSKGQVTIPASVRSALGLNAGSKIEFIEMENGKFAIMPARGSALALKGLLRSTGDPVTIEEMNAAIALRGALAR